jgi:hypothetical protein
MDDRIERLHNHDLADLVDRVLPDLTGATARQLVQVYNGGAMPSQPDHYYLTHPVYLNGVETEGGAGGSSIDVSQTIVVDVLGKAPHAGDILTAYSVGGRWVAELTGSETGKGCIQFLGCNGSPLVGVKLKIYDHEGGSQINSTFTSDDQGRICPGLDSKVYWMDPTETEALGFPLDKYIWTAQNFGIPASGATFWPTQLQPGYGCCPTVNFPLPTTLFLTVCGQTFPMLAGSGVILGWSLEGGTAPITTQGVAKVQNCNLGGWEPPVTSTQTVPWACRILCPTDNMNTTGLAGVCGIGHYNRLIGGFDIYAICPGECNGVGNAFSCCNGDAFPGPGVPFSLTGTIGDTVSLSGTMPGGMPASCTIPPANGWPMPCPNSGITVTN